MLNIKKSSFCVSVCFLLIFTSIDTLATLTTEHQSSNPSCTFLSFDFAMGHEIFYNRLDDVFENYPLFRLGVGVKYKKLFIDFTGQFHKRRPLEKMFVNRSGYLEESILLSTNDLSINFGYPLFNKNQMRFIPFVGLRWSRIYEDNRFYDPHPNWDLNAKSKGRIQGGLRLEYNSLRAGYENNMFNYFHWIYLELKLSKLKYNNSEYKESSVLEIIVGYHFDWRILK